MTPAPSCTIHRLARAASIGLVGAAAALSGCGGGGGAPAADGAAPATIDGTTASPQRASQAVAVVAPPQITSVTLRASATLYAGAGVAVTLRYKGVVAASVEVRAATATDYTLNLATPIDGGVLDLAVGNVSDAQGTPLRHLKVESLTIGSVGFLPTDLRMSFDQGDGVAAFDGQDVLPGRGTITVNGALRLQVPAAQQLTATGSAAAAVAPGAGYYVDSANGNDAGNGSSAQPWRTLARLAGVRLQAGQGLYLRCGGLWRESLSLAAAQLADGSTIAGYGTECSAGKAVISGADDYSGGWVRTGAVWSRALPAGTPKITQLFVEGLPMRTARWPDAGALALAGTPGASGATATAAALGQVALLPADAAALAGRDLAGATVQMRTQPWLIETRVATGAAGGAIGLDHPLAWSLDAGEGYVLQDQLWMLDSAGEYYHDTVAQRLYLIAPTTGAPADLNTARIEGSVRDVALALGGRSGLAVHDIALRAARVDGLRLTDAPQAQITRVEADDNGAGGIVLGQQNAPAAGLSGPALTDCVAAGNGQTGIDAGAVSAATISRNRVAATGTAVHQQGGVTAGIVGGPGADIEANTVDGAGYVGIRYSAQGGSVVAGNTVMGYCSRLSDCGALYTWQGLASAAAAPSARVEGNRVLAATAQLAGAVAAGREIVAGIYLDDGTRNVAVRGNTVAGAPIGVFLHNASAITVENNHVWLPGIAALAASMDQTGSDWMTGNVVRNNEFVPLVLAQATAGQLPRFTPSLAVVFQHSLDGAAALAAGRNAFSGNVVVQLQGPLAAHALLRGPAGDRSVDAIDWHALNPGDALPVRPARYSPLLPALGPEIVAGGGFGSGLFPWGSYRNPAGTGFAVQALTGLAGCSGPCVSLTAGNPGDLLASPGFALRPGVPHLYRWTAVMPAGAAAAVGRPYLSRNVYPWDDMNDANGYAGYGPRRGAAGEVLSYEAYFAPKAADLARVNLQLDTLGVAVAFDDVSVREVTGYTVAQAADWSALAIAPADAARTVGCAELGWPAGCSVIGLDGQPVALPLALAAGTQQLLLRADTPFKR